MSGPANAHAKGILALVNDLFFIAKIGDTAKFLSYPIAFTASAADFFGRLAQTRPALIIADLTISGVDISAVLHQLKADPRQASVPILGYTTHADWKRTGSLHDQCAKVVTKDTLSRSLPDLLRGMIAEQGRGEGGVEGSGHEDFVG